MPDFDFHVSSNEAVLALDTEHLALGNVLHIYNDSGDPAANIFLILPKAEASSSLVHWYSKIDFKKGSSADLIIALQSNTHIHNGNFSDFNSVGIIDHKLDRHSNQKVDFLEEYHNAKLLIDNFRTKQGIILCGQLCLLNAGKVQHFLGIKLHDVAPQLAITGNSVDDFLIGALDIKSPVNKLLLDKVYIQKALKHSHIDMLSIKRTYAGDAWQLENIQTVHGLALDTAGTNNQLSTDKIEINRLIAPNGKFYIAAKSYILFKTDEQQSLKGIDLVLDMSGSNKLGKIVEFPQSNGFNFDEVTIIKADKVSMTYGGSCKKLSFIDCVNVVANNLVAAEVKYHLKDKEGFLDCSGQIINNLLIAGRVKVFLGNIEATNIEANGLCNVSFFGATKCKRLMLNINIDAANPDNYITQLNSTLAIGNTGDYVVEIDQIFAKLSEFQVKGKAKLGTILIQTIDNLNTLLFVDVKIGAKLTLDRLYVADKYNLVVLPDGTIHIVRLERMLAGGSVHVDASITGDASHSEPKYFFIEAGKGIRFQGEIKKVDDIGLFTRYGDLFVKGFLQAHNSLSLLAQHGSVHVLEATLSAKCITVYSNTASYITESIMKAQDLVIYSLESSIQIHKSKLESCHIAIVASDEVNITDSSVSSTALAIRGGNIAVKDSEVITYDIFVQSIHDFLLIHSGINLVQYSYALFASSKEPGNLIFQGGLQLTCEVTLVGIFSSNKDNPLPQLQWQQVDFAKADIEPGKAYIDANRGFIIGSTISSKDSVIIRTKHSLEVVPLVLYNEVMAAGGLKLSAIKEVASKINAGVINIDAGKAATFVGAICKAATGSVKADVLHVLGSPEEIASQQDRIKAIATFLGNSPIYAEKINVGRYFEFTWSTSISQSIGNLGVYDNYSSRELAFTQASGDIVIDRSLTKYEKLYLNAEQGKILIISRGLQDIYRGSGGGEHGRNAAYDSRVVIGGDHVHLVADQLISHAGKFEVKGNLKIVTKEGVHLLPVAVHERLMYHLGSKTTVNEYVVRQVISEINAGYLDIDAGGALEAVSTLIKATRVRLNVSELKLRSEYDIFERHIHFVGAEKWHGGQQEWQDYTMDSLVLPTVISADQLFATVKGDTTIEAAHILVREESIIRTGGDIHLLPKYDIHVHDHVSSKSYLFNFHCGKLTVAGSKTVQEHFYGESPVPTIYYSGGSFYGYSEGKIHLLGAKVVGKDIFLVGQKGIKLEAAPYHKQHIVSITESGMRIGYTARSGEVSIGGSLFKTINKLDHSKLLYQAAEVIASNKLTIMSSDGELEVISSKLKFAKAAIKVRGMHFHTHHEMHRTEQTQTDMSIGINIGMQESLSGAAKTAGYLLDKSGTHWLDILDRGINLYKLHNDANQIVSDLRKVTSSSNPSKVAQNLKNLEMVRFGVWASSKASESSSATEHAKSIDNEIIGGNIDIQVDGKAIIEGIICQVDNFKLKAKELEVRASHDQVTSETTTCQIELSIPVAGNVRGGISSGSSASSGQSTLYHSDNMIMVKGQLEIIIDGDAKVSGVKLQASQVMVRAKNLVVESLQDVIQERMRGMELSIGTNLSGSFKELGGKAQVSSRDAAWSNAIGSIIGTQVAHVIVQQTLEIAGGLIANAEVTEDGKLTDKGKAYVEAGSIIVRQLHDYDNGRTLGLGTTLTQKVNARGELAWGVGLPVNCSFNEQSRDIMPVVGSGAVTLTQIGSSLPSNLSRDVSSHISEVVSEKAGINASAPISDMVEFIQDRISGIAKGVSAGDDQKSEEVEDDEEELRKLREAEAAKKKEQEEIEEIDYTLLLQAKSKQEEVQLNWETTQLLTSMFNVSSRQTHAAHTNQDSWTTEDVAALFDPDFVVKTYQPAKYKYILASRESSSSLNAIKIYDVKVASSASSINYSFGINTAQGSSLAGYTGVAISESLPVWESATLLGGKYILKKGIKMVPVVGTAVGVGYLYYSGDYSPGNIAKNLVPYADLAYDAYSAYQYVKMKFIGVKPSVPESIISGNTQQIVPVWKAPGKPAAINFKEMARVDRQGPNTLIVPYMDLDPNAGKPIILSTPIVDYRAYTLSTPAEDLTRFSRLPGFEEHNIDWASILSTPDHGDIANSMNILFKKQYPDTVEKINDRYPINGDLAGQKYPLPQELQDLYPEGMWIKDNGCPDFTPYIYKDENGRLYRVEIDDLIGDVSNDFRKANNAIGIKRLPLGYTWHHHENGITMEAVPTNLHKAVPHTGGAAKQRYLTSK